MKVFLAMLYTRNTCNLRFMKTTIGQRIADARATAGLNQSQLAAKLNVAPQSVQQWERDKTTPRRTRIESLAALLSISPEWILFGKEALSTPATHTPEQINEAKSSYQIADVVTSGKISDIVYIPLLNSAAELTAEIEVEMDLADTQIILGKALLAQYGLSEGSGAALLAVNDDMAPRIRRGDTLLINLTEKSACDGAIYAIAVGPKIKFRRLIAQLNGDWLITCDNTSTHDYREETLSTESFEQLNVLGRVVMVMGGV